MTKQFHHHAQNDAFWGVARNLLRGQTRESRGWKSPAGSRGRIWKP